MTDATESLNDPDGYPTEARARSLAFDAALLRVYQALEERIPEVAWTVDLSELRIYSRALCIQCHPSRQSSPLWDIVPLPGGWGPTVARTPDAWRAWQDGVARLVPWIRTPSDLASVAQRIHHRGRQEAVQSLR